VTRAFALRKSGTKQKKLPFFAGDFILHWNAANATNAAAISDNKNNLLEAPRNQQTEHVKKSLLFVGKS